MDILAYIDRIEDLYGNVLPRRKPPRPIEDQYQDYKQVQGMFEPRTQMYIEREMGFKFGGGVEAQKKGTAASQKYFEQRKVDKPTPIFRGPEGKAKLVDAKFANKAQEAEYLKLLEDRFKFPKGSKEARKVASNADLAKKFGITNDVVERVNRVLIRENELTYPIQTYEGKEKIHRERDVRRKKDIGKTSATGMESKIKRAIKAIDPKVLAEELDLAHRASLNANANLGADYLTTSLGLDKKVVNQKLVKPIEQKLGTLYKNQLKLIKGLKPGEVPKDVQKQIEKINKKISELSDRTKGALQGVLIDEKTLKPSIYGIDYKKVLGAGLVDKPVKDLTKADLDLIKLQIPEQIKAAKAGTSNVVESIKAKSQILKPPVSGGSNVLSFLGTGQMESGLSKFGKSKLGKGVTLLAKGEGIFAPLFLYGGAAYGLPFTRNINEASYGVLGKSKSEYLIDKHPKAKRVIELLDAQTEYNTLLDNYKKATPATQLQFKNKMLAKQKEFEEKVATFNAIPEEEKMELGQAYQVAEQSYEDELKQRRERHFSNYIIPKKELFTDIAGNLSSVFETPVSATENVFGAPIPTGQVQTEFAGGGIASLTRTVAPPRGPQYRGLDYLKYYGR